MKYLVMILLSLHLIAGEKPKVETVVKPWSGGTLTIYNYNDLTGKYEIFFYLGERQVMSKKIYTNSKSLDTIHIRLSDKILYDKIHIDLFPHRADGSRTEGLLGISEIKFKIKGKPSANTFNVEVSEDSDKKGSSSKEMFDNKVRKNNGWKAELSDENARTLRGQVWVELTKKAG